MGAFEIKQLMKMMIQHVLLPSVYHFYRRKAILKNLVIFADAHHNTLPPSMRQMYERVKAEGYDIQEFFLDFGNCSIRQMIKHMVSFMKMYAQAGCVFICDYYLPASSCRKKTETALVQLWHACGAFKKIGYDANDDIPGIYRGDVFKNYDLVTVSAPYCVPIYTKAMKLAEGVVNATGISRTDAFYNEKQQSQNQRKFYENYPQAKGKKILLWAPTFRGNASNPKVNGLDTILRVKEFYKDEWYIIIKVHPHVEAKEKISNCTMDTEELLSFIDLLVTDYSSVLFDYLLFEKPFLLFAEDLDEYESERGFYTDIHSFPGTILTTESELIQAISQEFSEEYKSEIKSCREYHMGSCDGLATERILNWINERYQRNIK